MKRIVFLIIASLLVLGLVLPGCNGNGPEENYITIAVCGPMTFIQGEDHWAGAQMAAEEINNTGGVSINGTPYDIALVQVETNEILDVTGADGTTALTAVIDNVDLVIGGFRTEAVVVYREVAMTAQKIFIDCGAATKLLCESVLTDYDTYKYFFKGTPFNEVFLVTNALKQLAMVNIQLRTAAGLGLWPGDPTELRLAVMMEDAEWCNPMLPYIMGFCPAYGINYTGMQNCESDATDLGTQLGAIALDDPHITFTLLSGPPGKAYGSQQATYLPDTFSTGINVEAQDIDYNNDTGAEYHCTMDTWAEGLELTATTLGFFANFVAETGRYPTYCAATYDVIKNLKLCIEDVGLGTDAMITWMEDLNNAYTGTAATTAYYPTPAIDLSGLNITGVDAGLSAAQAYALYPHLPDLYGETYEQMETNWMAHLLDTDTTMGGFTNAHGFVPHDTVYGPGWQTGAAVQWQPAGNWSKVGWWPIQLGPGEPYDTLLTDKYGNWNFAYPGTVALAIPPAWIAAHGP